MSPQPCRNPHKNHSLTEWMFNSNQKWLGRSSCCKQDCWVHAGERGTSLYLPFVRSHWLTSPMRNALTVALQEPPSRRQVRVSGSWDEHLSGTYLLKARCRRAVSCFCKCKGEERRFVGAFDLHAWQELLSHNHVFALISTCYRSVRKQT